MAENVCEAGASEKSQALHLLGRKIYFFCVFERDTTLSRVGCVLANRIGY